MKSKLPRVGDTIFSEMSALANKHDSINLSQGFPNFGAPDKLIDLVEKHMRSGKNQYPPMPGVPTLRNALSEKMKALYGVELDPETEITITAGATQAIQMAITALVHPGDEVLMFDPAYDVYDPCVRINGGIPNHIKLTAPEFNVDWQEIEEVIGEDTSMIIINTPHNPTGTIFDRQDMEQVSRLAEEHDLWVLSDEVYQHMVYDDERHCSVLSIPSLRRRSLAACSFGKTYHVTGWKVGYLTAPEKLMNEFRKVFQYGMFAVSSPMQHAIADFLEFSQHYLQLATFYQKKRDLFRELLAESRFELLPCEGTYYQCASYKNISDESDRVFVKRLIRDYGVAAIPISPFYEDDVDQRIVRFCFAKKESTLKKAGKRLLAI